MSGVTRIKASIITALLMLISQNAAAVSQKFFDGLTAFDNGKYCDAKDIWKREVERQDGASAFGLGELYARGLCVDESQSKAARWYLQSALWGYARGRAEMGIRYAYGKGVNADFVKSYVWLTLAKRTLSNWDAQTLDAVSKNLGIMSERLTPAGRSAGDKVVEKFEKTYQMPDEYCVAQ
jgi:TPR repeat protein